MKRDERRSTWWGWALVGLWICTAVNARAAALAPTKGSQLVTTYATGGCGIGGLTTLNAAAFNQVVQPDGSTTTLTIPPKHILVITDVTASASGLTANDVHFLQVVIGTVDHASSVVARFETAPASGVLSETFDFPSGIVVKSDSTACFQFADFTHPAFFVGFLAIAHGFIAPDK